MDLPDDPRGLGVEAPRMDDRSVEGEKHGEVIGWTWMEYEPFFIWVWVKTLVPLVTQVIAGSKWM